MALLRRDRHRSLPDRLGSIGRSGLEVATDRLHDTGDDLADRARDLLDRGAHLRDRAVDLRDHAPDVRHLADDLRERLPGARPARRRRRWVRVAAGFGLVGVLVAAFRIRRRRTGRAAPRPEVDLREPEPAAPETPAPETPAVDTRPSDSQVAGRAALLPEEEAAGSGDPVAQAEAILAESEQRVAGRAPRTQIDRRTSEDTTDTP